MNAEQAQLTLQIVSKLDRRAVTGEWPEQRCYHCNGSSSGYYDSQDFSHADDCITLLISELRRSMREGV